MRRCRGRELIEAAGKEAAIRGLHRAYRDEIHAGPDRFDEAVERNGLHAHAAIGVGQEGEQDGGEVLLRGEDARAVGECRRDEAGECRDLIADGHSIGGDADQIRE